ncbi:TetR/AcrR family transcriptional regulator, partial [Actinomadura adrarensis]
AGALDLFWDTIRQPPALALMELALAGRTDEDLRVLSAGLNERVIEIVKEVFQDLFPESLPDEQVDTLIRAMFALMVGLSLQNSLDDDARGNQAKVLEELKNLARLLVPDTADTPGTGTPQAADSENTAPTRTTPPTPRERAQ